tara:strand:- start:158 stop:1162 length:1005 start_codon:yes stop_codon:yes gene_type:complete
MKKKTIVIAEAGINHNGNLNRALKMVDVAKTAGANFIKFQTFNPNSLATKKAKKASYQKKSNDFTKNQLDMLKKYTLNHKDFLRIFNYCKKKKILFLSSAFDLESLIFLKKIGCRVYKIPSGEINNVPYLKKLGSFNKKIFLSTGMSNLNEIKYSINVLVKSGTKKSNITVLHCVSEYPAKFKKLNLNAIKFLKKKLNMNIGYSDHSLGIEAPISAVSIGASVIEKHFTLNKNLRGPDHKMSLDGNELKQMIQCVRNIELSLGVNNKIVSKAENSIKKLVRKSIIAKKNISKGEIFTKINLTTKRPGNGMSPTYWEKILGKKSKRNFQKDEKIR